MNLTRIPLIPILSLVLFQAFAADPNAPISVPTPPATIKVAAVGDSITAGVGTPNRSTDGYPAQLGQLLGNQWEVKNFGRSGSTLLNRGDRPYQKTPAFAAALALRPDVVLIMLGTNDTKPQNWDKKDEFVADYKDLISKFKALEKSPRIFICYPPFVVGDGAFGINEAGVIEQISMIEQIAKDENVGLIDIHASLKDRPELSGDKVHPNFKGATAMAKAFYRALTGKEYTGVDPTPATPPVPQPSPPPAPAPAASATPAM